MLKKFVQYYKPHKKLIAFVLSMVVIFSLIELSIPVFTRAILNEYVPQNRVDDVIKACVAMIVLSLIYAVAHYCVGYFGHILGIRIEKDMRMKAFAKLQELPFSYYDTSKTGVIMSYLTSDVHEATELAHHGIEEVVSLSLMLVIGYIYLVQMNFVVTTVLFIVFLSLMMMLLFARRGMMKSFRKLRRNHAQLNSKLEGSITGVRLTRAFANEMYEIEQFNIDNDVYMDSYKEAYHALGIANAMNNIFVQAISIAVIIAGTYLVLNQQFSAGDMMAYYIYFSLLVGPIKRVMTMMETFQQGWAGFERYISLLEEPVRISNPKDAIVLDDITGDIILDDISFAYGKDKKDVLSNFSLTIPKGKMVALVGPSGVGKTTITQLIPRFYDIDSGTITIDGHDIKRLDLQALRSQIGYIQQDVIIFYGSIAQNIAYGKPGATLKEIEDAAKKAGIHEFIMSLPHKYDTKVGERGVMLSGGQKQRISIARIFLKDPKILILDEATSALDNITESYIQASLEALAKGRTVIVVAHRLTTVQRSDEIIVMGKQGIAQRGKHEDLVNTPGHYKDLYEASENNVLPSDLEF